MTIDRKINVAVCKKRTDLKYANKIVTWSAFVDRLKKSKITSESMAEYLQMSKDEQGEIKDVGGFISGYLKDGERKIQNVSRKSFIALDIDDGLKPEQLTDLELAPFEMVIYGTHKYTPKKPRVRVIIPLDRDVDPTEYEFLARYVADELLGIDTFDPTTFQTNRMMYWPSTPRDIDYYFNHVEGDYFLPVDTYLKKVVDYKDVSSWKRAKSENTEVSKRSGKLTDPRLKEGAVGVFTSVYSPQDAIEKFLSDIYRYEERTGRYTFIPGSSSNGLRIYEDSLTVKAEDATDPANIGTSINAFDLVRIHKFGNLDKDISEDTPIARRPSHKAMLEFVESDSECIEFKKNRLFDDLGLKEASEEATKTVTDELDMIKPKKAKKGLKTEGKDNQEIDNSWMDDLKIMTKGKKSFIAPSTENILLILRNDINLKDKIGYDCFKQLKCIFEKMPWKRNRTNFWSNLDDAGIRIYLENTYHIEARGKIEDCVDIVAEEHPIHPIKKFLESRTWDKKPRIENLFIKYLGAPDNEYVRMITRKTLVAAVARIYEPGIKWDYMIVLVGPQGIGKSLLLNKLGGDWFQDTIPDLRSKGAYEALDGVWIVEVGELAVLNKADRETIKQFISKREDTYRKAYGRNVEVSKRSCIFIGTTNEDDFLNDTTGNRRFLPINCYLGKPQEHVWDISNEEIRQIWAEAKHLYDQGDQIMNIPTAILKEAEEAQKSVSYVDNWTSQISDWLNKPVPMFYFDLSISERQKWNRASDQYKEEIIASRKKEGHDVTMYTRTKVCTNEIGCELFLFDNGKIDRATTYRINECLRALKSEGWQHSEKLKTFGPYGRQRCYVRFIEQEGSEQEDD